MPETALMLGLATTVYLAIKLAKEFESTDDEFNQGLFTVSLFFLMGLMYTGYGIADSAGIEEAIASYLVGFLVISVTWVGFMVKIVAKYRAKSSDSSELEKLTG